MRIPQQYGYRAISIMIFIRCRSRRGGLVCPRSGRGGGSTLAGAPGGAARAWRARPSAYSGQKGGPVYWANIHSFPGSCSLALAWMVCAREEQSLPETRRPDRASMPRCAPGDLAFPKCKPSYMDWSRTACTAPARSWYTTGGSMGIGRAFYGTVGHPSRTTSIFGKSEMWGRHISLCPPKGPKMRSRLPYRSVRDGDLLPA